MFLLDIVSLLIFLAFIFSLVTTFTEIKSSSSRKRMRRQNNPQQSRQQRGRAAERGRYNDPVFNSSGRTGSSSNSQRRDRERRQQDIGNRPPLVSSENASASKIQKNPRRDRESLSTSSYMTSVVKLDQKKPQKKKTSSASVTNLKGKQLRQAIIYKEILDKPVSLRDE